MTPREFKAWFEGFTEAFTGTPTKAQWARIKERVSEIDGMPITERVFIDRYWHYPYYWTYNTAGSPIYSTTTQGGATTSNQVFNAATSMYALGKADASALGATS